MPDGYTINNVTARATHAEAGTVKNGGVTVVVSVGNASVLNGGKATCTATFDPRGVLMSDTQPCIGAATPSMALLPRACNNGNDVAKALTVDLEGRLQR